MNTPKPSLRRGLTALMSSGLTSELNKADSSHSRQLPIAAIQQGPSQPRKRMDQEPLEELAASIKAKGVLQPILVRPIAEPGAGSARYEIVAGERRWRASQLAGLIEIPVLIRELNDEEAVAIALIENIQREALTAVEEGRALLRLTQEFRLTHGAVAQAVGRSRAAVSNLIRLLELPTEVIALVDAGTLSMGHARALLGLTDDPDALVDLAHNVVADDLTVRKTEALVGLRVRHGKAPPLRKRSSSVEVSEICNTPDVRVRLHQELGGAGKLVVEFEDRDARDALIDAIKDAVSSFRE